MGHHHRVPWPRFFVACANFGDSRTYNAVIGLLLICAYGSLCENLTSFTKPDVHSKILYRRQTGTKPRPQLTCRENIVEGEHVVFEIWERTDRQTYTLIAILEPLAGRSKMNNINTAAVTSFGECSSHFVSPFPSIL